MMHDEWQISAWNAFNLNQNYVDDNMVKTDEKYVAGRLIRTSLVPIFRTLWSLLLRDMLPVWHKTACI